MCNTFKDFGDVTLYLFSVDNISICQQKKKKIVIKKVVEIFRNKIHTKSIQTLRNQA